VGFNALRNYGKQKEEEERRRNIVVGVNWSISEEFGGSTHDALASFKGFLVNQFGWHIEMQSGGVLRLRRGDFSLKSIPAERYIAWDDVPINLSATFSRSSPSKTRVHAQFAAPAGLEFTREARSWFNETAAKEWAGIFEHGRHYCPLWVKAAWNGQLNCPTSWHDLRTGVRSVLSNELRWSFQGSEGSADMFRRGSARAFSASSNGRVKWVEIPVTLEVKLERQAPTQDVLFRFLADEDIDFDRELRGFFHESAARELDAILERLNEYFQPTQQETSADEEDANEESEDGSEDASDETEDEEEDDLDPALKAALETLELTDTATWRDVQTAHRRLAKKYHPDAHSSRRLTPQQLKKLEREFSKATEAYDRLRDFFRD
jgi:DnaJ-domain-containing protein 1